ncbi:MAG: hypothetical protein OSB69_20250, partial [Alphaproteobacteria bacterium]|nr:hypothetical protein [Alphaproteobacteria bacterium]
MSQFDDISLKHKHAIKIVKYLRAMEMARLNIPRELFKGYGANTMKLPKLGLLASVAVGALLVQVVPQHTALAEGCPAITVAKDQGITGAFPQQFELSEYQSKANCTLTFSANPNIAELNGKIQGNAALPALKDRLPEEPLVVAPYDVIGTYGGTLDMISNALEAGTSDLLSVRHVNLVRFSDDLVTIVPNIAKSWSFNE